MEIQAQHALENVVFLASPDLTKRPHNTKETGKKKKKKQDKKAKKRRKYERRNDKKKKRERERKMSYVKFKDE